MKYNAQRETQHNDIFVMLSVLYVVSFMPSGTNNTFMLSVFMLSVVMLSAVILSVAGPAE